MPGPVSSAQELVECSVLEECSSGPAVGGRLPPARPLPCPGVSVAGSVLAFVGAGAFQGVKGAGAQAAKFRVSPSARFRGLFGLPGHFPSPLPAAPVSWPGSSLSSFFSGPGFRVFVWALRLRGLRGCQAVDRARTSGNTGPPSSPPRSCWSRLVAHFARLLFWLA